MRFIYDVIFLLFSLGYLPYFLIKRKYHPDFLQRFGIFKQDTFSSIPPTRPIWLHAVSLGEMNAAKGLIKKMHRLFPSRRFVISNVTKTGHDIAVSVAREEDIVIYFPLDISFVVRRLLDLVNPSVFISIETELWPNLISQLHSRGIPIVLLNGRISGSSYRNYRLVRPVIRTLLQKITLFGMRTETDAERIKDLGAPPARVVVTGNMKFDAVPTAAGGEETDEWVVIRKNEAWLPHSSKLIIAGSTHRGEDIKVLDSYRCLRKIFRDIRLLIAPRHIERVSEIESLISRCGLRPVRLSEVEMCCNDKGRCDYTAEEVFILDSIGRLGTLYSLATVVFLGGSLVPRGGHNVIEPAVYAKPVVTGPYIHNFRDMSELFERNGALRVVRNADELTSVLRELLSDEIQRISIGERAKKVVTDNVGSTDRNILLLEQYIGDPVVRTRAN